MNDKVRTSIVDANGKSTHVWRRILPAVKDLKDRLTTVSVAPRTSTATTQQADGGQFAIERDSDAMRVKPPVVGEKLYLDEDNDLIQGRDHQGVITKVEGSWVTLNTGKSFNLDTAEYWAVMKEFSSALPMPPQE